MPVCHSVNLVCLAELFLTIADAALGCGGDAAENGN